MALSPTYLDPTTSIRTTGVPTVPGQGPTAPSGPPTSEDDWARLTQSTMNDHSAWENYSRSMGLDPGGRYEGNSAAHQLLPGEFNLEAHQLGFANELQPQQHAAIRSMVNLLQNPNLMSEENRAAVMGQVNQHLPELYNHLQSTGAGLGAQQGAMVSQLNQGAGSANAFDANLNSAAGIMGRGNALNALTASQAPTYQGINTLAGIEEGTPRNKTGLDVIGGLAGDFLAGGGLKAK